MDPYKVLGITPQTSDDDVKRAYRELARKYHPDNYVNNPLADLAEARMKEINEAYDMIMNQRSGKASSQQTGYNDTYQQNTTDSGIYGKIRSAITSGNLAMAEEMLARLSGRDAGWYDEAQRCYTQACSMDPANLEYKSALNNLNMGANYGGYRPMSTVSTCDCCTQLLCCNCLANCCCGGGC